MNKGREPSDDAQATSTTLTLSTGNPYYEALADLLRDKSLIHHHNGVRLRFTRPDGTVEMYTVYVGRNAKQYQRSLQQLNWSNH